MQVISAGTLHPLLTNNREQVVVFDDELCGSGVVTALVEAGDLDETGGLPVAGNGGRLGLDELHAVLQLKHHSIVQDSIDEVDESGVAPEHGEKGVLWWLSIIILRQKTAFHLPC